MSVKIGWSALLFEKTRKTAAGYEKLQKSAGKNYRRILYYASTGAAVRAETS